LASLTAAQNPGGNLGQHNDGGGRPYIHIGMHKGMGGRGPRPPRPAGTIDVIGAPSQNPIRPMAPRENVIQVMTADRREYSRTVVNQNPQMPMQFNVPPEDFYHEEQDAFNYGYEPTQDGNQWEGNSNWAPSEIKELTPMNQPPPGAGMHNAPPLNIPPPMMQMMPPQNMIPPLMGQMPMIKQEMEDKRDNRRMGRGDNRDFNRDDRRHDDRKRMRERSNSRERDLRKQERPPREERPRSERERHPRESSSRSAAGSSSSASASIRSKSRERGKRSKSRDRKRSRSRDHKSKRERSKKEEA
jgi:pre-mRNA 3'-end-processing factor FIP1